MGPKMNLLHRIKSHMSHKLIAFKWSTIKQTFKEHGLALVVIIVGWEIIEDIIFPAIFALLGNYVHPIFFTGIPVAWIVCLHWFMVPILWGWWIKITKNRNQQQIDIDCCHKEEEV
jgi:hypothetical protein